ncbi:MAG: hypothetical protein ACI8YQ_001881 [Polaribacter sp.]|jgi:hypothetical protein
MSNLITNWRKIAIGVTLISALAYMMVFLPEHTFKQLAKEDGILEWTCTLLFFITAILFFVLFFRNNSFAKIEVANFYNTYTKRIWFLLLALLFIFLTGEEISWGQRLLGLETPEEIAANNEQGEINFHNNALWHLYDKDGNRKSGLALHLTAKRIFIYIFTIFMLFLPLTVKFVPFVRNLVKRFHLPVPVMELGFMFVANVVLYLIFKPIASYDKEIARALSEVQELNFSLVLFFLPFVWFGVGKVAEHSSVSGKVERVRS